LHALKKEGTRTHSVSVDSSIWCGLALCFGVIGLHLPNKRLWMAVCQKTGPGWRYGLRNIHQEFSAAKKAKDGLTMGKIAMRTVCSAGHVLGVKAVAQLLFGTMTMEDWLKTGAIAIAQLTIWLGTEGAAAIAQIAMVALSAEGLIEDSVKLGQLMK
jgi:hypothetical protein